MSSPKDINDKDLKKLEDEAYFELRQIIAEAMQLQDIELLDSRISSWKSKYKKLLDRPSTSSKSDFKKRIEFLLNQYYSSVTRYILNQLKLKEEKKIQNQAKALRELYNTIKNTNDYDLLKKKVKKWKEKYPISGFLNMYQKRIQLYTRDKNLKENAFKQEEAFFDLVDITKKHATLDELKEEVNLWEKKYSINNKYSIDDFIKHQSEVKRFISDEFLISIARDDPKPNAIDKNEIDLTTEYTNKSFSNLSVQASSYASLLAISRSPNNIDEIFRWVYKNSHIKFNDKYKELILNATYLEYSPTYLNKLSKPKMDMSKSSLSFDEYRNMDDIKRYAIISYFNLLLPPDKAIPNDYFNKHIQVIYSKSERARVENHIKDDSTSIEDVIDFGTEIPLISSNKNISIDSSVPNEDIKSNIPKEKTIKAVKNSISISSIQEKNDKSSTIIGTSNVESELDIDSDFDRSDKISQSNEKDTTIQDKIPNLPNNEEENELDTAYEKPKSELLHSECLDTVVKEPIYTESEQNDTTLNLDTTNEPTDVEYEQNDTTLDLDTSEGTTPNDEIVNSAIDTDSHESELDYNTVVVLSPLFFSAINNYDKQAVLINHIDDTATKYVELEKSKSLETDATIKTKNNLD